MNTPSTEELTYLDKNYEYDPESGQIIRKELLYPGTQSIQKERKVVGSIQNKYIKVSILALKKTYYAHHLAWYLYHGKWPQQNLDHIDGNGTNNRIDNLRLANAQTNSYNRGKNKNSGSSQYKGVSYNKNSKKWAAYITHNYKRIFLGYFNAEIEAAQAYNQKATEIFGTFAQLNEI